MKIRNVELIIAKWQVSSIRYAKDWPDSGGEKKVGVLRILTDSGFEGNAFMGSYLHAATEGIMKNSIENAREELLGQNPLLPEKYAEDALYWKDQGYKAYKIHPGGVPKKEVIAICKQVKNAVGDGMILMLDCSQAYTYETAPTIK